MRTRLWWIFAGAGLGAIVGYFLAPPGAAQALIYDGLDLSCATAVLWGVRANRAESRLPWFLFAGALALWALGDGIWDVYELVLHRDTPQASWADASYLAAYPLLAVAVIVLVRRRNPGSDTDGLIDGGILTVAGSVLAWQFLIAPRLAAAGGSANGGLLALATDISYPVGDILVIAVLARLVVSGGRRQPSLRMLLAAMGCLLAADVVYARLTLSDSYYTGHPVDALFLASRVMFGVAALHHSMARLGDRQLREESRISLGRMAMMGAALTLGPFTEVVARRLGTTVDIRVLALASVVGTVLVMVRVRRLVNATADARERLSWVLERTTDGFLAIDFQGRFTYVNPAAEQILERPAGELIGQHLAGRMPEAIERAFDDLSVSALFDETLPARTVFDPLRRRWTEVQAYKSPHGVSAYLRNVSVQHEAEIRSRLQAGALDACLDPIVICDLALRVIYANPAFTASTGLTLGEVRYAPLHGFGHPDARRLLGESVGVVRTGGVWRAVVPGLRGDGSIRAQDVVVSPIFDRSGAVANVVVVMRDRTTRRTPLRAPAGSHA